MAFRCKRIADNPGKFTGNQNAHSPPPFKGQEGFDFPRRGLRMAHPHRLTPEVSAIAPGALHMESAGDFMGFNRVRAFTEEGNSVAVYKRGRVYWYDFVFNG